MKIFLDSSVVLAACGSPEGAARAVTRLAPRQEWELIVSPYVLQEAAANASRSFVDLREWGRIRPLLAVTDNVYVVDRIVVFESAKDRPILFSALACAEVLLTHDTGDFGSLMNTSFYGLWVTTPGQFLRRERDNGRLTLH